MKKFIVANIIPTGVGANIGGYVGDATPTTNLIASICDYTITHPNTINGVLLNCAKNNILYVEGFLLDKFFLGKIGLRLVRSNRIGVILDNYPERQAIDLAINTIEAVRTNKGINVVNYILTKKAINPIATKTKSGSFVGKIADINLFLKPTKQLIQQGAEAIAISTKINVNDKDLELYFNGSGVNPYGGVEALISHSISKVFNIQSAHAPLFSKKETRQLLDRGLSDPRAGADSISAAYLGSVLQGLHQAPKPIAINERQLNDITIDDISAVITPASCLGGVPVLSAKKRNIPIIAVKENTTILHLSNEKLKLKNIIMADNYIEAVGILAAIKEGLSIDTLRRPIKRVQKLGQVK